MTTEDKKDLQDSELVIEDTSNPTNKYNQQTLNYKQAGVDVEAGYELVQQIKPYVKKTLRPEIISGLGSFSALSRIPSHIKNPILVTCTDGVGTKIEIARELNFFETIGIDLVAMSVNDLIVEMSSNHKMIEPFEHGQVREGKDNERLISYGTSSHKKKARVHWKGDF